MVKQHVQLNQHKQPSSKCTLVCRAYEKYGSFEVETLVEVENDQLNELEIKYIKEYNTLSPNGLNLTSGGEGGIPSEETRERLRKESCI